MFSFVFVEPSASHTSDDLSTMSKSDLFFPAESDEEEEEFQFVPAGPSSQSSPRKTSRSSSTKESLFIPEDDDVVAVGGTSSPQPSSSKRKEMEPASSPPESGIRPGFVRGYLGEFVCEGWSLSKGKGYCSPGSKIVFERPNQKKNTAKNDDGHQKIGPARLVNGKMVQAKSKIGGKQMSLKSMMAKKPPPAVSFMRCT